MKRSIFLGVAALALLVSGVNFASAGGTTTGASWGPEVHACLLPKGGGQGSDVRILNAGSRCNSLETALNWNQQGPPGKDGLAGPAGPAGPQGPQGPQGPSGALARAFSYLDASRFTTVTATNYPLQTVATLRLPAGKFVINGDLALSGNDTMTSDGFHHTSGGFCLVREANLGATHETTYGDAIGSGSLRVNWAHGMPLVATVASSAPFDVHIDCLSDDAAAPMVVRRVFLVATEVSSIERQVPPAPQ
jgi:hypothetical protein